MKRISYLLSLLFLLNLVFFTSCGDDTPDPEDEEETTEQVKTRQLTSGTFTVQSISKGGEDVTPATKPTIKFNTNGTYELSSADAFPSPHGSTLATTGEWEFTDTQNFNITVTPSGAQAFQLSNVDLTDNSFNFTYPGAGLKPADPAVTVTVNSTK